MGVSRYSPVLRLIETENTREQNTTFQTDTKQKYLDFF